MYRSRCFCSGSDFLSVASKADEKEYARPDVVGCVLIVQDADFDFYGDLLSTCFARAGEYCEALVTGPPLACLRDTFSNVLEYVTRNRARLPAQVTRNGWERTKYLRTLKNIDDGVASTRHCDAERAFETEICKSAAVFVALSDLVRASKQAGVRLPEP